MAGVIGAHQESALELGEVLPADDGRPADQPATNGPNTRAVTSRATVAGLLNGQSLTVGAQAVAGPYPAMSSRRSDQ